MSWRRRRRYHCLPLFTTVYHFLTTSLPLPYHSLPLPYHCLLLLTTAYHCLPLLTTPHHCLPLLTTPYHSLPLLTTCLPGELAEKTASFDSDPHFWMPLTLKEADYLAVMAKKGTPADEAAAHYKRMADFKARLGFESVLGCVDVGQKAYWWDYGRLELYMQAALPSSMRRMRDTRYVRYVYVTRTLRALHAHVRLVLSAQVETCVSVHCRYSLSCRCTPAATCPL